MRVTERPSTRDEAKQMMEALDDRLGDVIDTACRQHPECVEEFAQNAGFGSTQGVKDVSTRVSNIIYRQVEQEQWNEAQEELSSIHHKIETNRVYLPDCLDGNEFPRNSYKTRDRVTASNALNLYSIKDITKMMVDIARQARRLN